MRKQNAKLMREYFDKWFVEGVWTEWRDCDEKVFVPNWWLEEVFKTHSKHFVQRSIDAERALDESHQRFERFAAAADAYYRETQLYIADLEKKVLRYEASIQVNCEGCPAKQLAPCEQDD